MKKKILLPNNTFGCLLMLGLILACGIVPYVISHWLLSLVAPLWVTIPTALGITLFTFCKLVTFK